MNEGEGRDGAVIVLEGSINPAIFTPVWLKWQTLVSREDSEDAHIIFADQDLSRFDISHFRVEARRDRVTVASGKALETFMPVSDFVKGILEVLVHTPITAIGMSRVVHLSLEEGRWETLAKQLIPERPWTTILENPGLEVLSVTSEREGGSTVEVSIEESRLIPGGMYVVATERLEWPDPKETGRGAREALNALERWDPWLTEANAIIEAIRELT